jgi:hypothetical protein
MRFGAKGELRMSNPAEMKRPPVKDSYEYIIVGAGASGSIIAGELSKIGADVLIVEAGGADEAPTISNPSIWFYNVGSPLDWPLPIAPVPQLNNRKFNMALGHVLGGAVQSMPWCGYAAWSVIMTPGNEAARRDGDSTTSYQPTKPRRTGRVVLMTGVGQAGPFTFASPAIHTQRLQYS